MRAVDEPAGLTLVLGRGLGSNQSARVLQYDGNTKVSDTRPCCRQLHSQ